MATKRYDAIKQRGESWSFVVRLPVPGGKSKAERYTFRSEEEATLKYDELQRQKRDKSAKVSSPDTVSDFLERWLIDYAQGSTTAKTQQEYAKLIRTHIKDNIGAIKLKKLETCHIQGMYTKLRHSGRRDGKGGLSPQTIILVHRCLSKALKTAVVDWKELQNNPAIGAKPDKRGDLDHTFLTGAQTIRLWETAKGTNWHLPILLATTTGMRRSEILALKWGDLDMERGTLMVDEALEQTQEHGIRFKPPKTKSGKRRLPLMSFVVEALREHRVEQLRYRSELGDLYRDQNLVLAAHDGAPVSPNGFSGRFAEFMQRHPEIPKVRFHDLRHSVASLLADINENPAKVKALLGHEDIKITLAFYSHLYPGALDDTRDRLEGIYRRAMEG